MRKCVRCAVVAVIVLAGSLLWTLDAQAQNSGRTNEQLVEALQGKWDRDYLNNKGEWIRREKTVSGNQETVRDFSSDNKLIRDWRVKFVVEQVAKRYPLFRVTHWQGLEEGAEWREEKQGFSYLFDVDDNYFYEVVNIKGNTVKHRRQKEIANLNENTLNGLKNWVGKWRASYTPNSIKGYGTLESVPHQVDFICDWDETRTMLVWRWLVSLKKTGKIVMSVHGFVSWNTEKETIIMTYSTSNGTHVEGTVLPRGNATVMRRTGKGVDGTFTEICVLSFPNEDTMVHTIENRVLNGSMVEDDLPITLKRVKK